MKVLRLKDMDTVTEWVQSPIFVVCPILETKQLRKRKSLTVPILRRT